MTYILSKHKSLKGAISLLLITLLVISGCSPATKASKPVSDLKDWEEVIKNGSDQEVSILMWGGNEGINHYMDTFVADYMKSTYNVTLNRVPMNAPEYLAKLLNEKKNGVDLGTADLLWINAENFRTAKDGGLLSGPFTDLLPSLKNYYDPNSPDLHFDSGIPIEGYEGVWGKAQLVLSYDSAIVTDPPKNFAQLKEWVKANPGKFTYPKLPDDFVGTAFVRTAYYELTGEYDKFQTDISQSDFEALSQPVIDYFNEIEPYLWHEGTTYPATQAQMDDLFKNGELAMTMGFEVGKTPGLVASGVYPETVKTYVFDTGSIGNAHYLAIPYNSPQQAAALLLIDFLQSPTAQLEKMNPSVWGDMPAFDVTKITDEERETLATYDSVEGAISLLDLTNKRLPEMRAQYIDWIKILWVENIGK